MSGKASPFGTSNSIGSFKIELLCENWHWHTSKFLELQNSKNMRGDLIVIFVYRLRKSMRVTIKFRSFPQQLINLASSWYPILLKNGFINHSHKIDKQCLFQVSSAHCTFLFVQMSHLHTSDGFQMFVGYVLLDLLKLFSNFPPPEIYHIKLTHMKLPKFRKRRSVLDPTYLLSPHFLFQSQSHLSRTPISYKA